MNTVKRDVVENLHEQMLQIGRSARAAAELLARAPAPVKRAAFDDPVGQVIGAWQRPNGLKIERVRVPLGVIGIIYESRPNVTADAAALCLKSGNAAILRGGSDSTQSGRAIHSALEQGLRGAGLPAAD